MYRFHSVWLAMFAFAATGCCNLPDERQTLKPMVELIRTTQGSSVRVSISAYGVARVDFAEVNGGDRRSFLLPANPSEVRRLANDIAALSDSMKAHDRRIDMSPGAEDPALGKIVIRYKMAQCAGVVELNAAALSRDLVWKGVVDEIEMVGLFEVANAIDFYRNAKEMLARGDIDGAIWQYQHAIKTFNGWTGSRITRYPGCIYEPGMGVKFRYPISKDGAEMVVQGGVPPDLMELPGITPKWALKLLTTYWKKYTEPIRMRVVDGVTLVDFVDDYGDVFGVSPSKLRGDLLEPTPFRRR
jgi:hypothetical protein